MLPQTIRCFALALGCCCFAFSSQEFQPSASPQGNQKRVRVTGIVVNSATGAGVPRALVHAFGLTQRSVLTGADGRFELADLPEGDYGFQAQKPGFFNQQEVGGGPVFVRPAPVRDGMADVQLTLLPEGTIDGHVTDESGEPLENVNVQLKLSQVQNGRRQWAAEGSATTDESGEFHLGGLRPGTYALSAEGDPSTVAPRLPGQRFSLVLPPFYYPGAPSLEQAALIKITPGQQAQIDISMKPQPGFQVSGFVTNATPEGVSVALQREDESMPMSFATNAAKNGSFKTPPVAPGAYRLVAMGHSRYQPIGEVPVIVSNADVTGVRVALERPFSVPVHLTVTRTRSTELPSQYVFVGGSAQPVSTSGHGYATLRQSLTSFGFAVNISLNEGHSPDEAMVFPNLNPGRYWFSSVINPPYYLESARCGDTDLLESQLVVNPGSVPPPIQISLRDDSASIEVRSVEDGKPRESMILLIPNRGDPMELRMVHDVSLQVAPGTYKVYAFDSIADLEYTNPEVMREYSGGGQEVSVSANGSSTVTLEVIHRGKQ